MRRAARVDPLRPLCKAPRAPEATPCRRDHDPKRLDFEKALAELEAVVEQARARRAAAGGGAAQFERGIALARSCQDALKQAEQKVEILLQQDRRSGRARAVRARRRMTDAAVRRRATPGSCRRALEQLARARRARTRALAAPADAVRNGCTLRSVMPCSAPGSGSGPRWFTRPRRRSACRCRARRWCGLRRRADPRLLAGARRPARDGRRRPAPRPADLPSALSTRRRRSSPAIRCRCSRSQLLAHRIPGCRRTPAIRVRHDRPAGHGERHRRHGGRPGARSRRRGHSADLAEDRADAHALKTGALIRASVLMAAACAPRPCGAEQFDALDRVGAAMSASPSRSRTTSSTSRATRACSASRPGSDRARGKPTYPAVAGIDGGAARACANCTQAATRLCTAHGWADCARWQRCPDWLLTRSR